MAENGKKNQELFRKISEKNDKALKVKAEKAKSGAWAWFSFTGMVGWTIAVPTILFTIFGNWLDKTYPSQVSWTITLLVSGMVIGCYLAWKWVSKVNKGK